MFYYNIKGNVSIQILCIYIDPSFIILPVGNTRIVFFDIMLLEFCNFVVRYNNTKIPVFLIKTINSETQKKYKHKYMRNLIISKIKIKYFKNIF